MSSSLVSLPHATIEHRFVVIRGQSVMLDEDLATLYGVSTKRLNEQVRQNTDRFPADFIFRLSAVEALALRSQIPTSKAGRGGRRYMPHVFTEPLVSARPARGLLSTKRTSDRCGPLLSSETAHGFERSPLSSISLRRSVGTWRRTLLTRHSARP